MPFSEICDVNGLALTVYKYSSGELQSFSVSKRNALLVRLQIFECLRTTAKKPIKVIKKAIPSASQ